MADAYDKAEIEAVLKDAEEAVAKIDPSNPVAPIMPLFLALFRKQMETANSLNSLIATVNDHAVRLNRLDTNRR